MKPLSIRGAPADHHAPIAGKLHHCFRRIQRANPFFLHLSYFVVVSLLGFLLLELLPMKDRASDASRPSHLDLLFTSVSAVSVSSMTAVEMESFSNSQLLLLTLLMLVGGEVFTSMLSLFFTRPSITTTQELELEEGNASDRSIESDSLRHLRYVVLGYLGLVHATGSIFIVAYLSAFPSEKAVLDRKGIRAQTFAIFVAVSSFANCGFVPTNENMIAFRSATGMLLAVAAMVFLGNTLYPVGLRLLVWTLAKVTKREEFGFLLSDRRGSGFGYEHLMGGPELAALGATVAGFLLVQFAAFCGLEWRSRGLEGMSNYEKAVGAMFMSVNARHAGESVVDLSAVSPAILVVYVVMMLVLITWPSFLKRGPYLPSYTTFLPITEEDYSTASKDEKTTLRKSGIVQNILLSQLSYLAIFVVIICVTERRRITDDPLNFNVLNMVVEVISAYGNVGFSTGYSCDRRLRPDRQCEQSWVGFSGKWSKKGKLTLMVVMLFGRLKKFSLNGGKAWKLR